MTDRSRQDDIERLRTQLLAAAADDPNDIPRLKTEVLQQAEAGAISSEHATALLADLESISPESPTAWLGPRPDSTQVIAGRRVQSLEGEGPAVFAPGATIKNRFILQEQVGRGGMSEVFAAVDRRKVEARDPNPRVAIKVMNSELAGHPRAFMALQRETRKSQTLAHPNVATVYDFDREGDRVFMSMELLTGRPLDVLLRETDGNGIGREAALPIIRGITDGLAYAHRKGIVHSDLKPANVFLTDEKTAKILDFGIARALPAANRPGEPRDLFDMMSLRAYTEAYATIEMMDGGEPHPADDVYALGLIAYQLIAGVHPYQHCSARKARALGLKPQQPKGLKHREWRVLQRSLSFERSRRPRDAAEFGAQFFGVSRPQKVLIAATVLLGLAAAYASYRHYEDTGPRVAFEDLPAQTRVDFNAAMSDGERLWQFYKKDDNILALQEAAEQYARAYELHPGNRQAVGALQKVADAALAAAKGREQRRELAQGLARRSEYLASYPPILAASK